MALLRKFHLRKSRSNPVQDIIDNLKYILNTKKGYGSFLEDFGIGDYNAHHARGVIIETIIEELKENIEVYEPRVKLIDIKEVSSDLSFRIRFELKCEIIDVSEPIFIIFDSVLSDVEVEI